MCIYTPEVSNEYLKRWLESIHTHNFGYLSIRIHTYLNIMELLNSYSKFQILNTSYVCLDVVDFDSLQLELNIYKNHKISMNRIRTLKLMSVCSACCSVFCCFCLCVCFLQATRVICRHEYISKVMNRNE